MRLPGVSLLPVLATLAWATSATAQSVLLSEMCDPHQNYLTDRFIEIYNAGNDPVDLTGWSLVAVGNGGVIFTWTLSGSIDSGEALVAGDATTVDTFPVDFPDEAWSLNNSLWNGKVGDGARLLGPGFVVVDAAVATGTTFENETYVRNSDVLAPTPVYDPSEWTATPVSLASDGTPGSHDTLPPPAGPSIGNVVTSPAFPVAGDSVLVSADVTDTLATVVSAELWWGTSPGSLPNQIPMALVVGDTWTTVSAIPAQAQGVTVYFEIQASNDLPATTVLGFLSYAVPWEVAIVDVQGQVAVSPYEGETVITGGVVTGSYGPYFTIQDGFGPWNGLWVASSSTAVVGDSVVVRGLVSETSGLENSGNTLLTNAFVVASTSGAIVPAAAAVTTADLSIEQWEGVLVGVSSAQCTDPVLGPGEWEVDDGSGAGRVGSLGLEFDPFLGTEYDVTGCAAYRFGTFRVEPRSPADVVWVGDSFAPVLEMAIAANETTVVATFSEPLETTTAETAANYAVTGIDVHGAVLDETTQRKVTLRVSTMPAGPYTLSVSDVEDLFGNVLLGGFASFEFSPPPAGYYDSAEGLVGESLRAALHAIIDEHTPVPYPDTWTAFITTDDKPNGKVWDIYSDVPGGIPPYEYTFIVDQGGEGGVEGTGYNREHSWPQSWYGGVAPMTSDLFVLYPTDNYVNNQRGSDPYGEVVAPTWTSLNGSKRGDCSYPGYSGVAFEPIDEYKGDLARSYFYMSTRYYLEDGSWSTSPMTDGADLLPWAIAMLLEWHAEDPVSQKELARNGTIFGFQLNRNPFIDRPEFAERMLSPAVAVVEIEPAPGPAFALGRNFPNPFHPSTTIRFNLDREASVSMTIHDVAGRRVRSLVDGRVAEGAHATEWDGRDDAGGMVGSGVYFYRLRTDSRSATGKMVLLK